MGLRRSVGRAITWAREALLSSAFFPLTRVVPHGQSWMFDLQRYKGTRDVGAVFDVGANRGQTIEAVLKFAPRATLHSFEPGGNVFAKLEQAYGGRPNVHLHKMALGATRERRTLMLRENSELNTLVTADMAPGSPTEEIEVSTVDEMVARLGLDHLDLLKMDVQGWEREVLHGARDIIARHGVMFLLVEVTFRPDEAEMQQFSEFHADAGALGFTLCGFYDAVRYGPRKEFLLFANALYVHLEARLEWTDLKGEWNDWMAAQDARKP